MKPQLRSISAIALFSFCWTAVSLQFTLGFSPKTKASINNGRCRQFPCSQLSAEQLQGDRSEPDPSFFDNLLKSITDGFSKVTLDKTKKQFQKGTQSSKGVRKIPKVKVIIIGTGMSGLASAIELQKAGCTDFLIVDSADAPGGRVRTDIVNGFLLDRGFQVFIDSYPESNSIFDNDYSELQLKSFWPGALVHYDGAFHVVSDPFRRPQDLYASIISPIGSFIDKAKVGIYSVIIKLRSERDFFSREEITTMEHLSNREGISPLMINRFFKPFFQGIFLSPLDLQSSRMFEFVFKMFTIGSATLPKYGMGKVGEIVAKKIPPEKMMLNTRISSIETSMKDSSNADIRLYATDRISGERLLLESDQLIVATDPETARTLLIDGSTGEKGSTGIADVKIPDPRGSVCLYFGMEGPPPITQPCLILNGDKESDLNSEDKVDSITGGFVSTIVNNVCFPSQVSPAYAPSGKSLASVTIVGGGGTLSDDELATTVKQQLGEWWGEQVDSWTLLRIYRIPYAQPSQTPPYVFKKEPKVASGIYLCGDHRGSATLNGALESGRRAAKQALAEM